VQALKDTYDSSKEVSFDAANYFISSEHEIVCGHVGLNHIKIREDVIEEDIIITYFSGVQI
jgi:hypothetical protein